ncbi:LacI family DNA-binding transcriptional regulator [Vibrio penaeicida]|uniref:LacI family DNA-binding transcriptional regulator n=1 Tax=Vibrio penaeicida TaxID=104609 RepID=UPI002732F62D|nr:LacI family DNA-binding transcriptional regulator [Vibrio penaeicida]MDP2573043.1 LacI family DNA-binding transcriptional regulator [Vibrio penaeicida]
MGIKSVKTKVKVTSSAVAELAGVSRSAVSRTFSGGKVSQATREKVLKAAEELGYEENRLAKGLIKGKSGIVCIVADHIVQPWHSKLCDALIESIQNSGRAAFVITSGSGDAENALKRTIHFRAEATIILSGSPSRSVVEACIRFGQRLILLDREETFENCLNIRPDNLAAAERVCQLFLRAGFSKVAFAKSQSSSQGLTERMEAFQLEAKKKSLNTQFFEIGETSYEGGCQLANEILSHVDLPEAVFCASDLLACGFIDTARKKFGLDIPRDISVVGYDDIDQASWAGYDLTTFHQPPEEIARLAVDFINEEQPSKTVRIKSRFIVRSTVRTKMHG